MTCVSTLNCTNMVCVSLEFQMGNKNSKKAPPEPTAPQLPLEVNPVVDEKDYGKPYRSISFYGLL